MADAKYFRRRLEGENVSALKAIRYFCSECMGHSPAEVELCTDTECWLYPWRLKKTRTVKQNMSKETRERTNRNLLPFRRKQED